MNRYDGIIINAIGEAVPGCNVYVCNQPLTTPFGTIPPAPLATLYTDATGDTVLPNPVQADGNGNFFFTHQSASTLSFTATRTTASRQTRNTSLTSKSSLLAEAQ